MLPKSENSSTHPSVSSNTDPFGAFFNYAAHYWTAHLDGAPVGFSLDKVLKLASPTSAKHQAWVRASGWDHWHPSYLPHSPGLRDNPLCLLVCLGGNVSILEQQLDQLAQNRDGGGRFVIDAAIAAIYHGNLGYYRALMNHRSTAMTMRTVEMLETFVANWRNSGRDDGKEWTKLITDLFDTLSGTIHSPNYLLEKACLTRCMPIIEKVFERAKANRAFQEQLMQPINGFGPLGLIVYRGDVEILRYLCQQDGIAAHAYNRDGCGRSILSLCGDKPHRVEIFELLLDKFPRLMSEREGDMALANIIYFGLQTPDNLKIAKLLLQHAQAMPWLVDSVDEFLVMAVRVGWPGMCRMLVEDAHANPRKVVKVSCSGRLELKENCIKENQHKSFREPHEEVLESIAACLPQEMWQEMGNE